MLNTCTPKTGKCTPKVQSDGKTCDDGDPCTSGSACAAGKCAGGKPVCECKLDAECKAKDDGDPCNGTLYCEKVGGKGSCKPKPNSAITCSSAADTACSRNTCDPKTAKCAQKPVNSGKTCDDGNACTLGDVCAQGTCSSGKPKQCPGGDPCAAAACVPKTGQCTGSPLAEGAKCDDGSACTTGETCQNKSCKGQAANCDDSNSCTADACDTVTGKCSNKATGEGLPCDADGDKCTPLDACAAGVCKAGAKLVCDDGNGCTDDTCDTKLGKCVQQATTKACDADGSKCTKNDKCGGGKCHKGALTVCNDKNQCTTDSCDPKSGKCVFKHHTNYCNDGKSCTVGDKCAAGKCVGKVHCVDNNPCTKDNQCSGGHCNFKIPSGWHGWCGDKKTCSGTACVTRNPPSGMVVVAGTGPNGFAVGCPKARPGECDANERPGKTLRFRLHGFYIDKHEVRASQYKGCVKQGKCSKPAKIKGDGGATYNQPGMENHPINFVNQKQAKSFCTSQRPKGWLCTEAQWEWAARGKDLWRFPWGHDNNECWRANWSACGKKLLAVGGRSGGKSWCGARDMAGNVWEWVDGWYRPYSQWNDWTSDPHVPNDPGTGKKVNRGGGYWTGWQRIRTTERAAISPAKVEATRGFRCCAGF